MEKEWFAAMANGSVTYMDRKDKLGSAAWNAHPSFMGVYLKHLIKGEDTESQFSAHMVRIDPGCCLEEHCHENEWELHEVMEGEGELLLASTIHPYHLGRMAVIPKGKPHGVKAGNEGLVLLAKFFPALI